MKPKKTVDIPDPILLVLETELEALGRLPWSKLSKIRKMRITQGGLTGKVQDTRYPEVPHPQGLKKVFRVRFFLVHISHVRGI